MENVALISFITGGTVATAIHSWSTSTGVEEEGATRVEEESG